ncbi:MAG TPA: ABC transporter substrate-binding protein, partial [Dehalococcoidia bacterium]|nr:ABC transporter substrate-binding protein [Dehalococcoidia bacterium]
RFKFGHDVPQSTFIPEPHLAQASESPDRLTVTFKLRPGIKWHNVEPTNGRELAAQDVVWSFQRFAQTPQNLARANWLMVDNVQAPDPQTVVFKLKFPYSWFLYLAASFNDFWVMPRELIEKDGDGSKRMVGTGPWLFESFERDRVLKYRRNPDYWEQGADGKPIPYMDGVEAAIVTDVNQAFAQLNAGQVDEYFVLPVANKAAFQAQNPKATISPSISNLLDFAMFAPASFGAEKKPPFGDVRVRRAVSMLIDRDAILKLPVYGGVGQWDNVVPSGQGEFWLDPKGNEIGEAGKWYKFDPAEAKKLLEAAGFGAGFDVNLHFTPVVYRAVVPAYNAVAELLPGAFKQAGINATLVPEDYAARWIAADGILRAGAFDGMAYALQTPWPIVDLFLFNMLHSKGFSNSIKLNDQEVDRLIEAQRAEFDLERRRRLVFDVQRRASDQMYYVPSVSADTPVAVHPWVKNYITTARGWYSYPVEGGWAWAWLERS